MLILPIQSKRAPWTGTWWGEGEVKGYIDGDTDLPTLVGTGTEDYIGSAWGQGIYNNLYQGCLMSGEKNQWLFYRYHINDPIIFNTDFRFTIQQLGGSLGKDVAKMIDDGVPLIPVTRNSTRKEMIKFLEMDPPPDVHADSLANHWINFYREDDVSAVAYFYLDKPSNDLPELLNIEERVKELIDN